MASKRPLHAVSEAEDAAGSEEGEEQKVSVKCDPMERKTFATWDQLVEEFTEYQNRTFQPFRVRSTVTVAYQNNLRATQKTPQGPLPTYCGPPPSSDVKPTYIFSRKWVCTHSGDVRRRGTRIRKEKLVRTISCPAQARATMQSFTNDEGETRWRVVMTSLDAEHNHPVSERHFDHYAENRALSDPDLLAKAVEYHEVKAPISEIMKFLQKRSDKPVIAKDVQNLLQKLKQAKRQGSVEARLDRVLEAFCDQDLNNMARVLTDENKTATCVIFQTHAMRKMMSVFPEVLMIDATHGTNNANYKLFSFLVHDAFGRGQFVNHALIDGETKRNFSSVLAEFKANNPAWEKIRVVVVDKSFAEIAAIEAELPLARILLCQFHVLKYVGEKIAATTFGLAIRDAADKQALHSLRSSMKAAFKALTYAESEDEYEKTLAYLISLIPASDDGHFLKYFTKNWDQRRDLWVSYTRQDVPHLGNNTNNRIESGWSHLKPQLDENAPLDETVLDIIACQGLKQNSFDWKVTDIRARIHEDYDNHMQSLLRMVSHNAAALVYPEYLFATKEKKSKLPYDIQAVTKDLVAFRRPDEDSVAYTVNIKESTCTCKFYLTRLLPCRHVMIARRTMSRSVIPLGGIVTRWLIRSTDVEDAEVPKVSPYRVIPLGRSRSAFVTHDAKFREARQVAMSVVDVLTQFGSEQFNAGIVKLHHFLSELKGAKTFVDAGTQTDEYWSEPASQISLTQLFADETIFPRPTSGSDGGVSGAAESSDEGAAESGDEDTSSGEAEWQSEGILSQPRDEGGEALPQPEQTAHERDNAENRESTETPAQARDKPRNEPPFNLRPPTKVLGKPQTKTKQRTFMGNASVASTRYLVEMHSRGEEVPRIAEIEAEFLSSNASLDTLKKMQVYPVKMMSTMYPKVQGGMFPSQDVVRPVRYVLEFVVVQQCMKALGHLTGKGNPGGTSGGSGGSGGSGASEPSGGSGASEPSGGSGASEPSGGSGASEPSGASGGSGASGASGASGTVVDLAIDPDSPVVPGVRIHGLGVISQDDILSMRSFYTVKEELVNWKETIMWVKNCRFSKPEYAESDVAKSADQVAAKLSKIYRRDTMTDLGLMFLAHETFAYRDDIWLNDLCIDLAILRMIDLYGGPNCKYVAPTLLAARAPESITPLVERKGIVIYPVSISNEHWCAIIVNFEEMEIVTYDPLQVRSIYGTLSKICKDQFAPYLKGTYGNMKQREEREVRQKDGNNCGVFVISFVERYVRGKAFLALEAEDISFLRLSYISMVFKEE